MLQIPRVPVNATTANFEQEFFTGPEYVLLEFWAKWCGHCRTVEPVANDLASWRVGHLKAIKIDIDAEPVLANRFMVKATPTFILFKNGTQMARMEGAPKEKIELVQWVDQSVT